MLDAASLIGETLQVPIRGTVDRVDASTSGDCRSAFRAATRWNIAIRPTRGIRWPPLPSAKAGPWPARTWPPKRVSRICFCGKAASPAALLLPLQDRPARTSARLACSSDEPREFHVDDIEFADTIAHLLLSTIARLEVAQAFAAERQDAVDGARTRRVDRHYDRHGRTRDPRTRPAERSGLYRRRVARRPLWNAIARRPNCRRCGRVSEAAGDRQGGRIRKLAADKTGKRGGFAGRKPRCSTSRRPSVDGADRNRYHRPG